MGFGSVAMAWQALSRVAFKGQVDGHTPFYDSGLKELGDFSWKIMIGAEWEVNPQWRLDFGIVEDIAVNTAPDVVFHFVARRRF